MTEGRVAKGYEYQPNVHAGKPPGLQKNISFHRYTLKPTQETAKTQETEFCMYFSNGYSTTSGIVIVLLYQRRHTAPYGN